MAAMKVLFVFLVLIHLSHSAVTGSTCHVDANQTRDAVSAIATTFSKLPIYAYFNGTSHTWNKSLVLANCTDANQTLTELQTLTSSVKTLISTTLCACGVTQVVHIAVHTAHTTPSGQFIVIYVIFILFLGCVVRWMLNRFHINLQFTVVLLTLGIFFELFEYNFPKGFGHLGNGSRLVRCV